MFARYFLVVALDGAPLSTTPMTFVMSVGSLQMEIGATRPNISMRQISSANADFLRREQIIWKSQLFGRRVCAAHNAVQAFRQDNRLSPQEGFLSRLCVYAELLFMEMLLYDASPPHRPPGVGSDYAKIRKRLASALAKPDSERFDAVDLALSKGYPTLNVGEPPWMQTVPLGEIRWWLLIEENGPMTFENIRTLEGQRINHSLSSAAEAEGCDTVRAQAEALPPSPRRIGAALHEVRSTREFYRTDLAALSMRPGPQDRVPAQACAGTCDGQDYMHSHYALDDAASSDWLERMRGEHSRLDALLHRLALSRHSSSITRDVDVTALINSAVGAATERQTKLLRDLPNAAGLAATGRSESDLAPATTDNLRPNSDLGGGHNLDAGGKPGASSSPAALEDCKDSTLVTAADDPHAFTSASTMTPEGSADPFAGPVRVETNPVRPIHQEQDIQSLSSFCEKPVTIELVDGVPLAIRDVHLCSPAAPRLENTEDPALPLKGPRVEESLLSPLSPFHDSANPDVLSTYPNSETVLRNTASAAAGTAGIAAVPILPPSLVRKSRMAENGTTAVVSEYTTAVSDEGVDKLGTSTVGACLIAPVPPGQPTSESFTEEAAASPSVGDLTVHKSLSCPILENAEDDTAKRAGSSSVLLSGLRGNPASPSVHIHCVAGANVTPIALSLSTSPSPSSPSSSHRPTVHPAAHEAKTDPLPLLQTEAELRTESRPSPPSSFNAPMAPAVLGAGRPAIPTAVDLATTVDRSLCPTRETGLGARLQFSSLLSPHYPEVSSRTHDGNTRYDSSPPSPLLVAPVLGVPLFSPSPSPPRVAPDLSPFEFSPLTAEASMSKDEVQDEVLSHESELTPCTIASDLAAIESDSEVPQTSSLKRSRIEATSPPLIPDRERPAKRPRGASADRCGSSATRELTPDTRERDDRQVGSGPWMESVDDGQGSGNESPTSTVIDTGNHVACGNTPIPVNPASRKAVTTKVSTTNTAAEKSTTKDTAKQKAESRDKTEGKKGGNPKKPSRKKALTTKKAAEKKAGTAKAPERKAAEKKAATTKAAGQGGKSTRAAPASSNTTHYTRRNPDPAGMAIPLEKLGITY